MRRKPCQRRYRRRTSLCYKRLFSGAPVSWRISRAAESQEEDMLDSAKAILKLKKRPQTIEGLDISNLHGQMAVGTVVSFFDGRPRKSRYRNYRIKAVEGIDDYGMMAELVTRRLSEINSA